MAEVLTPLDVVTVRFHLLRFFPAELVQYILVGAEYWPRISSTFQPHKPMRLSATQKNAYIAIKCCILTPPISGVEGVNVRAKRVSFKIRSHDQGWGGEAAPGPYENSYSWFEAFIVRSYSGASGKETANAKEIKAMLEERDAHPRVLPGGIILREKVFTGSTPAQTMTLGTVANPRASAGASDVWEVQRNRRADSQEQAHDIVWVTQAEASSAKKEAKYFMETGSRMGVGFVDALRPGDRVAVLARAQYPGWANHVTSVSVDILLSV